MDGDEPSSSVHAYFFFFFFNSQMFINDETL